MTTNTYYCHIYTTITESNAAATSGARLSRLPDDRTLLWCRIDGSYHYFMPILSFLSFLLEFRASCGLSAHLTVLCTNSELAEEVEEYGIRFLTILTLSPPRSVLDDEACGSNEIDIVDAVDDSDDDEDEDEEVYTSVYSFRNDQLEYLSEEQVAC